MNRRLTRVLISSLFLRAYRLHCAGNPPHIANLRCGRGTNILHQRGGSHGDQTSNKR